MKTTTYPTRIMLFAWSLLFSANICADDGVFVVTTNADSGAGSLREAITLANADPTLPHIINFSIGSGVQTITLASALPAITSPYTLIDGATQSGWGIDSPQIIIDGSALTPFTVDCLTISGVHHCMIRALVINGGFNNGIVITDNGVGANNNTVTECFIGTDQTGTTASPNFNGIFISGSTNFSNNGNKIGGINLNQKNLISGNANCGILISTNVHDSLIQNNFIGTDITGTLSIANLNGGATVIGSLVPVFTEQCRGNIFESNVISGNSVAGIILKSNAFGTIIVVCNIGVDISGVLPLPNDIGILAQGQIGTDLDNPTNGAVDSTSITYLNVISGNNSHGIVFDTNVTNSIIASTSIGTDLTGTLAGLGNAGHGVLLTGTLNGPSVNNDIGAPDGTNIIAYNGAGLPGPFYGVLVDGDPTTPSNLNIISQNQIFNNNSDGIKLLNNGNDLQAAPQILNALLSADGNSIIVAVAAPALPASTTFIIDIFLNATDRTPITEGQIYLGSINGVASGATVVQLFTLPSHLSSNIWLSAVANNQPNQGVPGDSSAYSANFLMETVANTIQPIMFQ